MRVKREEKIEYINLWKESGLSKTEFCKMMGISYQCFLKWNKSISIQSEKSQDINKPCIVPVKITQEEDINTEGTYVILNLRTCSVKIMPGFPHSDLKKILELLGI